MAVKPQETLSSVGIVAYRGIRESDTIDLQGVRDVILRAASSHRAVHGHPFCLWVKARQIGNIRWRQQTVFVHNGWRQARGGSFRLAEISEAVAPSPARGVGPHPMIVKPHAGFMRSHTRFTLILWQIFVSAGQPSKSHHPILGPTL